jgi:hypothetical protein
MKTKLKLILSAVSVAALQRSVKPGAPLNLGRTRHRRRQMLLHSFVDDLRDGHFIGAGVLAPNGEVHRFSRSTA